MMLRAVQAPDLPRLPAHRAMSDAFVNRMMGGRAMAIAMPQMPLSREAMVRLIGAVTALALVIAGYALLGHGLEASVRAVAGTLDGTGDAAEPMPFERPGESFPGSAFYYLAPDDAAGPTASGPVAGLRALLGLDAPAADKGSGLGNGPAARALTITGAEDHDRALSCLTAAIYYEAATEPDAGQRAVAQVILNRRSHPSFPKTVCGVVYQGSERSTGCQFTFSCDGSMQRRKPMAFFWDRAQTVARAALSGYVYAPVGLATHYHTFAVHPYWADSLDFIGQIGAHRFYRFEGPAGGTNAFRFAYAGGEPAPGPHARSAAASAAAAPDPVSLERTYAAALKSAEAGTRAPEYAAPEYTSEQAKRGGDAVYRAANLPAGQNVRPEYQASGNWIGEPE